MLDIRQTTNYATYLKEIGWIVERKKETNYFIKIIPFLSVIKIQRPDTIDFEYISKLGEKYKAFKIIIEPKLTTSFRTLHGNLLYNKGYRISKSPYLPTKTLILDLTYSNEKILKGMKKDCRQAIKKNNKLIIEGYELKDINNFRNIWKRAVSLKRHVPHIKHLQALKKSLYNKSLFITDKDKTTGAIFLIGDKMGYYWQAFTNKRGRQQNTQYRIVWEGIKWAKKRGCKVFDFEGIYDKRFPNKSWRGFTHFKKSFGGEEIEYPGCYTKPTILNIIK